jgi:hypothetical protein
MLPQIDSPLFLVTIPSTKETVKFRPFTVKEEKILLIAQQSEDVEQIILSVQQVIRNCLVGDVDVEKLATYDLEYLFLQIRSKSVSNIVSLTIEQDDVEYKAELDLDDVHVIFPDGHENVIELDSNVSIVMKDPTFKILYQALSGGLEEGIEAQYDILSSSIDSVLVGEDQVVLMKDHTKEEQQAFIESFSRKNMMAIENFFLTIPKLSHEVTFQNADGGVIKQEVSGLINFFG